MSNNNRRGKSCLICTLFSAPVRWKTKRAGSTVDYCLVDDDDDDDLKDCAQKRCHLRLLEILGPLVCEEKNPNSKDESAVLC